MPQTTEVHVIETDRTQLVLAERELLHQLHYG